MPFRINQARVLIVVTVDAQQLPVAAVSRIVIVVVIPVMDGKLTNFFAAEFAAAAPAYPGKHFERALPVIPRPLFTLALQLRIQLFEFVYWWRILR